MPLVNIGDELQIRNSGKRPTGKRGSWWENPDVGPLFMPVTKKNCTQRKCFFPKYTAWPRAECYTTQTICDRSLAGAQNYNRVFEQDYTGTGHPESPFVKKIEYYSPAALGFVTKNKRYDYRVNVRSRSADLISIQTLVSNQRVDNTDVKYRVSGKLQLRVIKHVTTIPRRFYTCSQRVVSYNEFKEKCTPTVEWFRTNRHIVSLFNRSIYSPSYSYKDSFFEYGTGNIDVTNFNISVSSEEVTDELKNKKYSDSNRYYKETVDINMDFIWEPALYKYYRAMLRGYVDFECVSAVGILELQLLE